MRNRLRIWPIAFLTAIVASGIGDTVWAQSSARSVLAGRQEVEVALTVAMADGKLSFREKRAILRKGKVLLVQGDLQQLEQTLGRLANVSKYTPTVMPPDVTDEGEVTIVEDDEVTIVDEGEVTIVEDDIEKTSDEKTAEEITQAGLLIPEEAESTQDPSYDESADAESDGSPFKEENPPEGLELLDDVRGALADEFDVVVDGFGPLTEGWHSLQGCDAGWPDDGAHISLFTSVDAFKGPMDLDNRNGNFGTQFGFNAGLPLAKRLGIGTQVGTSAVLSNFHGTQFTGSRIRSQYFTTAGIFQRLPLGARRLRYGLAFDWLSDRYYSKFSMSQWRVKLAYDVTPFHEIGIWACIPNSGDAAVVGGGVTENHVNSFRPIPQGYLYWNHFWPCSSANTTAWIGIAEEPGEFIFGGDGRIPISPRLSLVGNVNYLQPSASGQLGQDEEIWNVSVGLEFTLGRGRNQLRNPKFAPLFSLANNGSFAVRRF